MTTESDIVERLRKCLKANAGISGNVELWSPVKDDEIREAADEIERLREAVAAERAAIVELVESFVRSWDQDDVTSWHEAAKRIAAAIKARGTE
jgi:hypothetical protein